VIQAGRASPLDRVADKKLPVVAQLGDVHYLMAGVAVYAPAFGDGAEMVYVEDVPTSAVVVANDPSSQGYSSQLQLGVVTTVLKFTETAVWSEE
jgi:hypothetical protein